MVVCVLETYIKPALGVMGVYVATLDYTIASLCDGIHDLMVDGIQ